MKKVVVFIGIFVCLLFLCSSVFSQAKIPLKTKFYNFDDLLIQGQYRKPQILYTDAKQKVEFDRLLKLKKDFLPKLKATQKDSVLR